MDDRASSLSRSRAFAVLAVLAPALGGSTELWARGVLLVATAALLIVWPPRRSPGACWIILALALAGLAAAAFLPASWFPTPAWRQLLTGTFEVPLVATRSAQPWQTTEAGGLCLSALIFALALFAHPWSREERRDAARFYALGILFLSGLAVGAHFASWHVPWWPRAANSGAGFGFFPNRNQTSNVLALAGIMATALGFEALSRRRKAGYGWFAGVVLLGVALVLAYSRAGIALFFCGAAAWVLLSMRFAAAKKGPALVFAAVAILLTAFLLFGGETLERFRREPGSPVTDFRVVIQRDAVRVAALQPWLGTGLGNFEPVYAITRSESSEQTRALHPESDWLWAAVELGWPAVVLLVGALLLWGKETLPFSPDSDRHLRSAAAVCGVAFALHGLVDVSGHRAGALWPALFLFSLARNPDRVGAERAWAAPAFRCCALLMAGIGAWWIASANSPEKLQTWPTSATLAWLEQRLERENAQADYPAVLATADEALRIAPLRWNLYYQRAVAHAGTPGGLSRAVADFDTARFLEPRWIPLPMNEAMVWLALDEPQLTLDAWTEALRRAGPDAPTLFGQLLGTGWSRLSLRTGLARLAETNADLLLRYLERTDGLEFDVVTGRLLDRDPTLAIFSPGQRKHFFDIWFGRGDRSRLISLMVAHPEWQEEAWLGLAQHYAGKGDYERAWRYVQRYGPTPALPQLGSSQSLAELERSFYYHPEDVQQGLALFAVLRAQQRNDDALTTLRTVSRLATRPSYVPYLEAELWAEKGDWAKAWEAWQRFAVATQIR
jgi:tetratricopeptide (TPR) repeat protein